MKKQNILRVVTICIARLKMANRCKKNKAKIGGYARTNYIYLIPMVLLCSLLTSCVAAIVAGATGLVVYDKRSVAMIERDARIFYRINTSIAKDPRFRDAHITVSSFNQIVLLAGQAPTASLKILAAGIAKKTPNVSRVYNEIAIQEPTSFSQRSKDTWITSQVKALMLTRKGLESGSIRVVTENSVVYLLGIATHEQANLAVEVARQVKDVHKVVKIFRYIV